MAYADAQGRTLQQRMRANKNELWSKRSSYDTLCRELAKFISPRSGRFQVDDKNRGEKKHEYILDSTATGAHEVLVSGIASGLTNRTQKWLRLATPSQELNKEHDVKVWLEQATDILLDIFNDSNTYEALTHYYGESSLFGTSCGIVEADERNVIHHYPLTWGQYALATNDKGEVDRMIREFSMTVAQMVMKFGLDRVSTGVQDQFRRRNFDQEVRIYHCVEPRALSERNPNKLDGKNMPWRSVYFEDSKSAHDVLRESGYRECPVLAHRWKVVGSNVYGDSPAMNALGPIIRLQSMTKVEGQVAALSAQPPLQGPPAVKGKEIQRGPNGYSETQPGHEIKPLYDSRAQPGMLDVMLLRVQDEINARLYRPLFSVISDAEKQMTAQEVREVAGERLAQLGPTIGRWDREKISKLVDITLGHAFDMGRLPPPPPQMSGLAIKAEMIGVLAQAQRAASSNTSDQLQMKIASHAQTDPRVRHLIDYEYDIRTYADTIGADPRILVSPSRYQEIVEAEAKAQAAQAQSAMMAETAGSAKDLAAASVTAQ